MKYSIENERVVFNDHYKILKAQTTYDTFNGETIKAKRLAFHRGDSVAVVLYEKDTDSILLTKQFRYPTTQHNEGWILEIPAGSLEKNENPSKCVEREVLEELGYQIKKSQLLSQFYTSPGGSTEKLSLFYAEVSSEDKIEKGGGVESEDEDIQLIKVPVKELGVYLLEKIIDAKTIIGLQWFLFQRMNEIKR
ncbi:MAG: ADP-ribose pyrophosphatase [Flavobacteriaceae bacterium]|jgi:ADP-ribose pyrophosphatase|nr:ADP-ribose pyrophosphatase [Flavobacteriaceae bacterium]HBY70060.1 ADP-ribose pyrophosphatase [Flavobacteriaceae bacterium]|tara:strand:+ start:16399 stop:16977 length:579 start_codon:yes stop_codon:yes gene_type:complete